MGASIGEKKSFSANLRGLCFFVFLQYKNHVHLPSLRKPEGVAE